MLREKGIAQSAVEGGSMWASTPTQGRGRLETAEKCHPAVMHFLKNKKMNKKCSILNKNLLMVYGKACYTEIENRTKSVFLALDFKLKLVF